ncbi:MAG: Translation initiation factor IF-2 [Candidatus Westeberhardia cardiocondylae]|nr:Translation initiation factor IF-2 [Candidatus Westeberhardia cardiocondylae]
MTDITVKLLSLEINTSVDRLLKQFSEAGINKTELDYVTQKEKEILLLYLKNNKGDNLNELILQRKKHSLLNVFGVGGKNKSIQVEIRKKRIFLKKSSFVQENHIRNNEILNKNNDINHIVNIKKNIDNIKNLKNVKNVFPRSLKEKKNNFVRVDKEKFFQKTKRGLIKDKDKWNKASFLKKASVIDQDINFKDNCFHNSKKYMHDFENNSNKSYCQSNKNSVKDKDFSYYLDYKVFRKNDNDSISNTVSTQYENKKNNIFSRKANINTKKNKKRRIIVDDFTISELSNKISVKSSEVMKIVSKLNIGIVNVNQKIPKKIVKFIVEKFGYQVVLHKKDFLEDSIVSYRKLHNDSFISLPRAPVVTIMGHVDHGKTSLLDYIRSEKTILKEIGGITQRIGAYHVKTNNGIITFIDTPGHEAFSLMRMRGANITDIVVLVIAIDDGLMPQTIESIQYAKKAQVPIIVAINKIDKLTTNLDNIKKELFTYGIQSEDWGGENQFVCISAKFGTGIDDLLCAILAQAEIMELKSVYDCMASGIVIDSYLNRGYGPITTILVKEGTIKKGDIVLCGLEYGRIRAIRDEFGRNIISAGPSTPVEIIGLSNVTIVGDKAIVVDNERKAKAVAINRKEKFKELKLYNQEKKSVSGNIFTKIKNNKVIIYNIVLKTDTQGSLEAISNSLLILSNELIKIKIIGCGVGDVTDSDVMLALSANSVLIGFNVRLVTLIRESFYEERIDIRMYSIIYNLIDDIKNEISKILSLKCDKQIIGLARVQNVFSSVIFDIVCGCIVIKGVLKKNNNMCIFRNKNIIYEGKLESLRRFKNDVDEVNCGMECGIGIKNFSDIHLGDIIKVFDNKI